MERRLSTHREGARADDEDRQASPAALPSTDVKRLRNTVMWKTGTALGPLLVGGGRGIDRLRRSEFMAITVPVSGPRFELAGENLFVEIGLADPPWGIYVG